MEIQKVSFANIGYYGRVAVENRVFSGNNIGINRLYYIHEGEIEIRVDKQTQILKKGHVYVIPNTLQCTMHTSYIDHTCFNFLTFPRIRSSSIIDIPLENEPILEAHICALALYVEKHPRVYRNINREQMGFVASSLKNILFLIDEKINFTISNDILIEDIIDYIHAHYAEKLSIAELAEQYHLEEGTFIRRFKRCTGTTPHRYLKLLRVHIAENLLKEGSRTLEDVAQAVGYADAPTLSHAMKDCKI